MRGIVRFQLTLNTLNTSVEYPSFAVNDLSPSERLEEICRCPVLKSTHLVSLCSDSLKYPEELASVDL